ncbi:MAG: hypothetical protein D3910_11285 [Candidatus Electrothrix sp. ATG2]|nr:hypothetical protein [Candidatus Electrothrix sp. ATG2]
MSWNVRCLQQNYAREVIGFDLRDISIEFGTFHNKDLIAIELKNKLPATIDNQIWPKYENKYEFDAQFNGFNLLDQVDAEVEELVAQHGMLLVAFDIPTELAKSLKATFGLIPHPLDSLPDEHGWRMLGFDIVDIRTQSSAFYSFSWTQVELRSIFQETALKINSYGIISSESEALKLSLYFDKIIPEHAPFFPCGVWVRQEPNGSK